MGKATASTAPSQSNPSRDATEAAAGHDHHRHHLLPHGGLHHHHRHQHPLPQSAKQTQPAARPVNRFEHPSDDINDCADAFIKRFHHQLELQRLQSIENYQKMLARSL